MRNLKQILVFLGLTFAVLLGTANLAQAQTDTLADDPVAADAAQAEGVAAAEQKGTIFGLFQKGGWAMWPLLALSVVTVTLVIYNLIMIRPKPFLRPDLVDELKPAFGNLDFEKANSVCDENPSVITNIVSAGLERVDPEHLDPQDIKDGMEESAAAELAAPYGMISYLSSVATLSPMVGLLGTVSGMVKAFGSISAQGMGNPQALAGNINEALITTASGLGVAIPAMIAFLIFKNRYAKIASSVSRLTGEIYFELLKSLRRNAAGE